MNSATSSYMTSSEWQALQAYFTCCAVFCLIMAAICIFVFWRILGKAGYSPWLSLLVLVPFGALVLLLVLAFGQWPALTSAYPSASYYGSAQSGGYTPPASGYMPPAPPAPPAYQPPVYQPPVQQPPAPPVEPPANPPYPEQ